MAKKRHHMTKHEYNAYKKRHLPHQHALDVEDEKVREEKTQYTKYRKRSDEKIQQLLRNTQGHSDDFSDEEYDEVYDLKAIKNLSNARTHKVRLRELERYEQ